MTELIKKQRFGIEVELTGISRSKAAKVVAEALGSTRISGPSNGCYDKRVVRDSEGRDWIIERDSSIAPTHTDGSFAGDDHRVEFVTPVLSYKDIETHQNIIRALRKAGAVVNESCGIHIHVDGSNHNAASLRRLVGFMVGRQDLIYDALNVGARKEQWCRPVSKKLFRRMKAEGEITRTAAEQIWYSRANDDYSYGIDHQHYNPTRYHGLNLHAFFSKGTIEFRLFNSTLHAGKIKAYVQFCLALSAWAITSEDNFSFRSTKNYTAVQKERLMHTLLTHRLGLSGKEFKTCRLHMLAELRKNAGLDTGAEAA